MEQQIKEEIKEYIFSFYSGLLFRQMSLQEHPE